MIYSELFSTGFLAYIVIISKLPESGIQASDIIFKALTRQTLQI